MSTAAESRPKRETLNLRIKADDRGLIDRAAQLLGKTRTDFVLDAARRAAEDALLDRSVLAVDDATFAAFVARLEAPTGPEDRLRRTFATPAPWDEA